MKTLKYHDTLIICAHTIRKERKGNNSVYTHSRKSPYPPGHHSKGTTDNEASADQCDALRLLIYALMKCVQQFTQLIKVPTGDYVQGKTNDQNEQK